MPITRFVSFACLLAIPACSAGQSPGAKVTRDEFRQLQWLAGQWRGSGGNYPSFFEEYRFLDDSTIQMRSFSDSMLRTATDSSRIEWRGGMIRSGSDGPVVTEFTTTSLRFMPPGAAAGGYTFTRVSDNEWTATLHPAAAGGTATVYVMKRIGGR
jgi:hypothetical protein